MLEATLNRLKPEAKEKITEGWAGFTALRMSTEQIFNLCEKYLQYQQNLYHTFFDGGHHAEVQYQCTSSWWH